MNTISHILLNQSSRCSLIPFITAGYPSVNTTIEVIKELDSQGADIIELGIPYSDALADGPVIQNASLFAIQQKVYIDQVLLILENLSQVISAPIIIFTYYNPVLKRGINCFIQQIAFAGAKGLIIPDLPLEEADGLILSCKRYNIELILFVAPTSSLTRIDLITKKSPGCIYLVSSTGVTGVRTSIDNTIIKLANYIKQVSDKFIMLGFGISTPLQAQYLSRWNIDGLVVGTAFVQKLSKCGSINGLKELSYFCKSLKQAMNK
uniref:tryptophan synthase alpha subunit n=1 Tax=Campylaephora boydenii TaxID=202204 RepID=UPI002551E205|nr:tryptophan synthase alpha subunit [Campylaephora boydenii]WGT74090.1 tryptophan synthase alpha subunit [Campylaephora boydenii]